MLIGGTSVLRSVFLVLLFPFCWNAWLDTVLASSCMTWIKTALPYNKLNSLCLEPWTVDSRRGDLPVGKFIVETMKRPAVLRWRVLLDVLMYLRVDVLDKRGVGRNPFMRKYFIHTPSINNIKGRFWHLRKCPSIYITRLLYLKAKLATIKWIR